MSYTETVKGVQVDFERVEEIDNHGHSIEWSMDGFTGSKLTHTAIGSFTFGRDELEEISDIQEV